MKRTCPIFAALTSLTFAATLAAADEPAGFVSLFDGESLSGWEGNLEMFRVQDGAIVAGSLAENIPHNDFLCTKKPYGDFELRLKCKLTPASGNAGIQFRSARIPDHFEVRGYQADMGQGWWGKLYDESRRAKVLAEPKPGVVEKVLKPGEWNEYRIRCRGDHIELWLNGVQTVDYTEPEKSLPATGIIGLQIHGGGPAEASYQDILIREL